MNRKLRDVEVLPDAAAQKVLLLDLPDDVLDETSSTVKGRTDTQHSETIRAD
jgi:hypothetical protein